MAGGLIGLGQSYRTDAMAGMRRSAELEQQRDTANKQFAAQEKSQKASLMATGGGMAAGLGMLGGLSATGVGAVAAIGIGAGYLLSELF